MILIRHGNEIPFVLNFDEEKDIYAVVIVTDPKATPPTQPAHTTESFICKRWCLSFQFQLPFRFNLRKIAQFKCRNALAQPKQSHLGIISGIIGENWKENFAEK